MVISVILLILHRIGENTNEKQYRTDGQYNADGNINEGCP